MLKLCASAQYLNLQTAIKSLYLGGIHLQPSVPGNNYHGNSPSPYFLSYPMDLAIRGDGCVSKQGLWIVEL